jgi:hypothetical protein
MSRVRGVAELPILRGRDGGGGVPAERLQRLADECLGVGGIEAAVCFGLFDQRQGAGGEDRALGQGGFGKAAQRRAFDQLQAQQRGEHAKRAGLQRLFVDGAKGRGMDRHASRCQVVIAHRLHAHDREQTGDGRQLCSGAQADRTVALHAQALDLAGTLQMLGQIRVALQHLCVSVGHQAHQRAVQRHFIPVHIGHRPGKALTDLVGADMCGTWHRKIPEG